MNARKEKPRRSGLAVRHPTLWRFLQLCPRAAWREPALRQPSRLQKALRLSPGSVQPVADSFEARATEEEKPQAVPDVMGKRHVFLAS
ncbi:MAG: hypothetical protein QOJ42_3135 [Acidobacteriaceae bacterium]|jgi:hypothetical protein|nr:hypothetical protein [Acidobacteriaceae bacterium]